MTFSYMSPLFYQLRNYDSSNEIHSHASILLINSETQPFICKIHCSLGENGDIANPSML